MKAITRIFMAMLTGLISVLGFTACSDDYDDGIMYGPPLSYYYSAIIILDGEVVDEQGDPISNSRVVFSPSYAYSSAPYSEYIDTIKPDNDGKYEKAYNVEYYGKSVRLICLDTADEYERDTAFVDIDTKTGDSFTAGTVPVYALIKGNFTLKKKSNNE